MTTRAGPEQYRPEMALPPYRQFAVARKFVTSLVPFDRGGLLTTVGFIVTNRSLPNERVGAFYNGRGTAEQHI
jgi:hypothetical protein